jgi:hypothetical protein
MYKEKTIRGSFIPKSAYGKWSAGQILVMFLLLSVGLSLENSRYDSVSAGESIMANINQRLTFPLSMFSGYGAGITVFITGLIAIIRENERKRLVYLAKLVGGTLLLSLIGEFLVPH